MPHSRIFVVDDEEAIREVLGYTLDEAGYAVTAFESGKAVLNAIVSGNIPELVVLDIRMPDMDGIAVLKQIKQSRPKLPVILCSAYGDYMQDFGSWCADCYFVKSEKMGELVEMIGKLLPRTKEGKG